MYVPIIKTGEAEIKALTKLTPSMMDGMMPIIELTRGRQKTTKAGDDKIISYPFANRLLKVKQAFKNRPIFMDLTTDESLLSNEIFELYNPDNGYQNWLHFIQENIGESGFSTIIPSILFNWLDNNFEQNFKRQIESLCEFCGAVMYRSSIQTKDCYDDIPLILKYLSSDCDLWIVMDVGYLQESAVDLAFNRCKQRIENITNEVIKGRQVHFIISATSYPERVFDYGEDNPIVFSSSEVSLHKKIKEVYPNIIYGDYAGTNPIRKDLIVMARGWIPRIDIPLVDKTKVYWKRRPKGTTEYRSTYIRLAEEVKNDPEFPNDISDEWGISEILATADGYISSSTPAFWISVRMYNHIYQQLKRLKFTE